MTKDHDQVQGMKKRIGQGWSVFCKLHNIMQNKNVPKRLKRKTFNDCIVPVMTYGCETRSLSNTQLEKLKPLLNIKGIEIGNKNKYVKLLQYADDALLYLNNTEEPFRALNLLTNFVNVAGTRLNSSKCEGMQLKILDTRHIRNDAFRIR